MATPRCTLGRRQRRRKEKRIPQGVRCSSLRMSLLPAQGPLGVCCPFLACVLDGGPLFLTLNVGLCWSLPSELLLSSESPVPASACIHRPSRDSCVLPHSCAFWQQKCWVTRSSSASWPSRLPPQSHLLPVVQSRSSSFLDAALGNFPFESEYSCSAPPWLIFRKTSDPSLQLRFRHDPKTLPAPSV